MTREQVNNLKFFKNMSLFHLIGDNWETNTQLMGVAIR